MLHTLFSKTQLEYCNYHLHRAAPSTGKSYPLSISFSHMQVQESIPQYQLLHGEKKILETANGIVVVTPTNLVYYSYNSSNGTLHYQSQRQLVTRTVKYLNHWDALFVESVSKDRSSTNIISYQTMANTPNIKLLPDTHHWHRSICGYTFNRISYTKLHETSHSSSLQPVSSMAIVYSTPIENVSLQYSSSTHSISIDSSSIAVFTFEPIQIFTECLSDQGKINRESIAPKTTSFLSSSTSPLFHFQLLEFKASHLIVSIFDTLHYSDLIEDRIYPPFQLQGNITCASRMGNSNFLIAVTDVGGVFQLNIKTKSITPLLNTPLPIIADQVNITTKHIILHGQHTGLLTIDRVSHQTGYIHNTLHRFDQSNLFTGISYAYSTDSNDLVISFTDGHNSILAKETNNIDVLRLHPHGGHSLLGFVDNHRFLTRSNNRYYLNGEVQTDLLDDVCAVAPNIRIYRDSIEYLEDEEEIQVINKGTVGALSISKDASIIYTDARLLVIIHPYPKGGYSFCEIPFTPLNIKRLSNSECHRDAKIDGIDAEELLQSYALFNETKLLIGSLSIPWSPEDPIKDVERVPNSLNRLYVLTYSGSLWEFNSVTYECVLILQSLKIKFLTSLGKATIVAIGNTLSIVNYKNSNKLEEIYKFDGDVLSYMKTSSSETYISVTSGLYRITESATPRFHEFPISGIVKERIQYSDSLSLIYSQSQLALYNDKSAEVFSIFSVPDIYQVRLDLELNPLTPTIIISTFTLNQTSFLIQLEYRNHSFQLVNYKPIDTYFPIHIEPYYGKYYSGLHVSSYRAATTKRKTDFSITQEIKTDMTYDLQNKRLLYISRGNRLAEVSQNSRSFKRGVRRIFTNQDGFIYLVDEDNAISIYEDKPHVISGIEEASSVGEYVWINDHSGQISEKPTRFKPGVLGFMVAGLKLGVTWVPDEEEKVILKRRKEKREDIRGLGSPNSSETESSSDMNSDSDSDTSSLDSGSASSDDETEQGSQDDAN